MKCCCIVVLYCSCVIVCGTLLYCSIYCYDCNKMRFTIFFSQVPQYGYWGTATFIVWRKEQGGPRELTEEWVPSSLSPAFHQSSRGRAVPDILFIHSVRNDLGRTKGRPSRSRDKAGPAWSPSVLPTDEDHVVSNHLAPGVVILLLLKDVGIASVASTVALLFKDVSIGMFWPTL